MMKFNPEIFKETFSFWFTGKIVKLFVGDSFNMLELILDGLLGIILQILAYLFLPIILIGILLHSTELHERDK